MLSDAIYKNIQTLIVNDRIAIRELSIEDAPAYMQYTKNPNVGRYVLVEKKSTLSYAISHINYCKNMIRNRYAISWAITDRSNNQMIGWLALYMNNFNHRGEIAFDLAEEYWRQGITTDVIATTVRHAFEDLGILRVEALLLKENTGSWKALMKNDFQHEGTLHGYKYHNNKCYDVEMYALTIEQFKQNNTLALKEQQKECA